MINNNLTPEEIQLNISAAFDSVELINNSTTTQEIIDINIEHLIVMMSKQWFVDALTKIQKSTIIKITNK